jgi:hypothetical protein
MSLFSSLFEKKTTTLIAIIFMFFCSTCHHRLLLMFLSKGEQLASMLLVLWKNWKR